MGSQTFNPMDPLREECLHPCVISTKVFGDNASK